MGVDIRVLEAIVRMLDGDSEALLSYKPKPRLSIRSNDLYSSEESSLFLDGTFLGQIGAMSVVESRQFVL